MKESFLNQKATQKLLASIVGISQPAVSEFVKKGVLIPGDTIGQWIIDYSANLRDQAAGRGGDDQVNLSKQRAKESVVKTAMLSLEYNEKVGALIPADEAASIITDWCASANREYQAGLLKLVGEIQSTYKINVDNKLVENIASPTFKRIKDHAADISRDFDPSSGDVLTTEDGADRGMD